MTQSDRKQPNLGATEYDRVLLRLANDLKQNEATSWDLLQEKIRDAVELELAAEEMTRDELDLLNAYLQRDLKRLGYFVHEAGEGLAAWLKFDLNALEYTFAEQLKLIADRTRIDQEELRERLAHDEHHYMAGELATVGTLKCVACEAELVLTKTTKLVECEQCSGRLFERL